MKKKVPSKRKTPATLRKDAEMIKLINEKLKLSKKKLNTMSRKKLSGLYLKAKGMV